MSPDAAGSPAGGGESKEGAAVGGGDDDPRMVVSTTASKLRGAEALFSEAYDNSSEPIFPPALMRHQPQALCVQGRRVTWHRPMTLPDLLALRAAHPKSKIIVGNTEVGIETKFKHFHYPVFITTTHVPELNRLVVSPDGGVEVGAAVTLSRLEEALEEHVRAVTAGGAAGSSTERHRSMLSMIRWFASTQIRNVAALVGNIVTVRSDSALVVHHSNRDSPMSVSLSLCLSVSLSLCLSISLSLCLSVSLSLCLSVSLFVYYICGRWGSGSGRGSLPKRPTEFTGVCAPGRARRRWPTETVCWVAAAAVREQRPELPGVGRDGAVHHQFRLHALRVQAGLRGPRNAAALEPLSP